MWSKTLCLSIVWDILIEVLTSSVENIDRYFTVKKFSFQIFSSSLSNVLLQPDTKITSFFPYFSSHSTVLSHITCIDSSVYGCEWNLPFVEFSTCLNSKKFQESRNILIQTKTKKYKRAYSAHSHFHIRPSLSVLIVILVRS